MKIISFDYVEGKDEEKALAKLVRAIRHHVPENSNRSGSKWRNIDVPEEATKTVVSFMVGDEVQRHEFSRDDVHQAEDASNVCSDDSPEAEQPAKRKPSGMFRMNTRYKGCTISVMVALGLSAFFVFFPIAHNTISQTEDSQQIAMNTTTFTRKPSSPRERAVETMRKSRRNYEKEPSKVGERTVESSIPSPMSTQSEDRIDASSIPSPMSTQSEDRIDASSIPSPLSPQSTDRIEAERLGEHAYDAILEKDYTAAEHLSLKGLEKDSTQHWIATNLAAALLFQGRTAEAEKIYRQYKNELKESFLDDFKAFEKAGVIPVECKEDVEHIRQILSK